MPLYKCVVDYLLFHHNNFDCITHFCILLPNSFSDHWGIEVNMAKNVAHKIKEKHKMMLPIKKLLFSGMKQKSTILTHYYLQKWMNLDN